MGNVIVTGASGGLGSAVCEHLCEAGWTVHAVARNAGAERDGVQWLTGDVSDPADAARIVSRAGALDALVCLVGGFAMGGRVHETPVAEFEHQFALNVRSAYVICAAALPALLAGDGGAIVCTASRAVQRPFAGAAGYIASKAALLGLVDALAAEYTAGGVRTNAIVPGVIDTPANRAAQPGADHSKWVSPAQIAPLVGFLCSPDSAPTSGARLPAFGAAT
ncbi:MAG: 3-oxoacyl-ACP reductase FabG [Solirubrobacteraceae bacterium]